MSITDPEVLPGSNEGPKGISIPTFYFLQRSYLTDRFVEFFTEKN